MGERKSPNARGAERGGGRGGEERRYGEIRKEREVDGTTVQPDAHIMLRLRCGSRVLKG